MKALTQFTFLLLFISILGCKRSDNQPETLCDGLMNESPPLKIGILLTDKQTGENLIFKHALTSADIKLSLSATSAPLNNWHLINTPGSPYNGIIELAVFHEKTGEYKYRIEAKGLANVEFSYNIKQEKSDSPCKIWYYPMDGLKAIGKDYKAFEYGGKTYPNVISVLLD